MTAFFFAPGSEVLFALLGLGMVIWLMGAGAKRIVGDFDNGSCEHLQMESPFIELNVEPVSEGDEIFYSYQLDGKYTALVANRGKHAKLDLEAESKEALEEKVRSTFRAWAIVGKKKRMS